MSNVQEIFGLVPNIKPYTNSRAPQIDVACPSLLYGVELEIEHASNCREWDIPGIDFKEDNSLRHDGIEVVTEPMSLSVLSYTLNRFFEKASLSDYNYSERCSVHVHANCRDLTLDQVSVVALLYQVFEHLLFQYAGNDRDKNIFCVPWYETTLTYNIVNSLVKGEHHKLRNWQKYTGLNLLPLYQFGTIEFRHLAGTCNRSFIVDWCNLIGCLFSFAHKHSLDETKEFIMGLNTTSEYQSTLEAVFNQWATHLTVPDYKLLLEEGVLNMKYSLLGGDKKELKSTIMRMPPLSERIRIVPTTVPLFDDDPFTPQTIA